MPLSPILTPLFSDLIINSVIPQVFNIKVNSVAIRPNLWMNYQKQIFFYQNHHFDHHYYQPHHTQVQFRLC